MPDIANLKSGSREMMTLRDAAISWLLDIGVGKTGHIQHVPSDQLFAHVNGLYTGGLVQFIKDSPDAVITSQDSHALLGDTPYNRAYWKNRLDRVSVEAQGVNPGLEE